MKIQLLLSLAITFLLILLTSCVSPIPPEMSQPYVDKHSGKSLNTLIEELRDNYEGVCLADGLLGSRCLSRVLQVNDASIHLDFMRDRETIRYNERVTFNKNIEGIFLIHAPDGTSIYGKNEDQMFDIFGYLTAIYNAKKENRKRPVASTYAATPQTAPPPQRSEPIKMAKGMPGKYHALLIANSKYKNLPNLETPQRDVNVLGKLLSDKYGFNVTTLIDADRDSVITALFDYRTMLQGRDKLLVFYAGHGWLDEAADEGYWLPVEADGQNPAHWISNSSITSALKALRADHVIVISDSCFSGKLTRGLRLNATVGSAIDTIIAKRARVVISSGGLEPVLDSGGEGGHSIFASALLDTLSSSDDVMDTFTLFSQIRSKVSWNADQVPEIGIIHKAGHEGGDFFFIPK